MNLSDSLLNGLSMRIFRRNRLSNWIRTGLLLAAVPLLAGGCGETTSSTSPGDATAAMVEASGDEPREPRSEAAQPAPTAKPTVTAEAMGEAALVGNTSVVVQAVEQGADVNAVDAQGVSALMKAAYNGHTPIVTFLLDQGADVTLRDQQGHTALFHAASGDNASSVVALVKAGAEVDVRDDGEGFTPLMVAAAEGQAEVVKVLLRHGADADLVDVDNDTALTFARQSGHDEVVALLEAGRTSAAGSPAQTGSANEAATGSSRLPDSETGNR